MTEKKNLRVLESMILPSERGNFGEVVNEDEGKLYLPTTIYQKFEYWLGGRTNIRDTYSLVCVIMGGPFAMKKIREELRWTDEEFRQAENETPNRSRAAGYLVKTREELAGSCLDLG